MADSLLVGRNFVSGVFKNLKKTQIKKLGFCQPCQLVTPKPCSHYLHYPGQGWKNMFLQFFFRFLRFFSFLRLLCFNLHTRYAGHKITTHKQRFGHTKATNRNSYLN